MACFWRGLLGSVLILAAAAVAQACDAVVVGRLASADGSVLLGHNEENALDRVIEFRKVPRLRPAVPGKLDLRRGGQLAALPESWAFLWIRSDMPHEIGCVYWRTTGNPAIA